jgi:hypothetical protein
MMTGTGDGMMAEEIEKPDEMTETQALLKILELGKRQVAEGKARPAKEVIERLRKKHGFSEGSRNRSGGA